MSALSDLIAAPIRDLVASMVNHELPAITIEETAAQIEAALGIEQEGEPYCAVHGYGECSYGVAVYRIKGLEAKEQT